MSHSLKYLKEYTAYHLETFTQAHSSPLHSHSVSFNGPTLPCKTDLPSHILDTDQTIDRLYILRWTIKSISSAYLDIFEFEDKGYRRLIFNMKPSLITVTNELIYVVGGQELLVIDLNNFKTINSYVVVSEQLFALEPAFLGSGQRHKGVHLYSWNDRSGLTKRAYSRDSGQANGFWSFAKNLMKKGDPSSHGILKIVIPNVLGLLFHQNQPEVSVVNLAEMKVVTQAKFRSQDGSQFQRPSSITIKFEQSHAEGFDDALIIGVGDWESQIITIFRIELMYLEKPKKVLLEQRRMGGNAQLPPLSSFVNGYIVDWDKTQISGSLTVCVGGKVIDFILCQKGLIYISECATLIPTANYIEFACPEYHHPILPLEHNVCRLYMEDSLMNVNFKEKEQAEMMGNNQQNLINSILAPNRYHLPFVLSATGANDLRKLKVSMLEPRKLLLNWNKMYKIRALIRFNHDIVVLRDSSLSTFLPIPKEQFNLEFQSGEEFLRHFHESSSMDRSNSISFISKTSSKFNNNLQVLSGPNQVKNIISPEIKDGVVLSFERNWARESRPEAMEEENVQEGQVHKEAGDQIYGKFLSQLLNLIATKNPENGSPRQDLENEDLIQNKSPVFAQTLLHNRIKDMLNFYFTLLNRSQQHSDYIEEKYSTQALLLHYLRYFSLIQGDSLSMVCELGVDLLSLLINKHHKIDQSRAWVNVDAEAEQVLKALFLDLLLPSCPQAGVSLNLMVKQLIWLQKNRLYLFAKKALIMLFNPNGNLEFLPRTYSVLAGVLTLPIQLNSKSRFVNSFILSKVHQDRPFSETASRTLLQFKALIRCLPNIDKGDYEAIFRENLAILGGPHYEPMLSLPGESLPIQTSDPTSLGWDSELDIDFWKLIRYSESEEMERVLISKDCQTINQIKQLVLSERKASQKGHAKNNDDLLAAWVFLYRCFVQKLEASFGQSGMSKTEVQDLAISAHQSLLNVSEYYQRSYRAAPAPSEEQLIGKICARMVGLKEVTLYKSLRPDWGLLEVIICAAKSNESCFEVFSSFQNVIFGHLSRHFHEDGDDVIHEEIQTLLRYAKPEEILEIIMGVTELKRIYQNQLSEETKSLLQSKHTKGPH